jgi:hypothetical protein
MFLFAAYFLIMITYIIFSFILWLDKSIPRTINIWFVRQNLIWHGPAYAQFIALCLGLCVYLCFGCTSIVVYCLESLEISSPSIRYDGEVRSVSVVSPVKGDFDICLNGQAKYSLLDKEAYAYSKWVGHHLYIVNVKGYGELVHNPNTVEAFYGLNKSGVLVPHYEFYNCFINTSGQVERFPT